MVEEVIDSPVGWVAKHINSYVDSGGDERVELWRLMCGPTG